MTFQSFGLLRLSTIRLGNINTTFFYRNFVLYCSSIYFSSIFVLSDLYLLFLYINVQFNFTLLMFSISSFVWFYLRITVGYFASLVKAFKLCQILTLPAPYISGSCIKIKTNVNFYFTLLCGASKGFMKSLEAFKKPFEALQRMEKTKI